MVKKVLHIVNTWRTGGTERFIESVVVANHDIEISHSILSVCSTVNTSIGCPTYGPLIRHEGMLAMLIGGKCLGSFLKTHPFDVIHVHTQNSSGFYYAAIAKRKGVACRIIHSHSSRLGQGNMLAKSLAQHLVRACFSGSETVRIACSDAAGSHLFPHRDYVLIRNGVDIRKFKFCDDARQAKRNELGIPSNAFVVGCVGMLVPVKNHVRSIRIFQELLEINPSSYLVIVGDGDLRLKIQSEITKRGLDNRVLMIGAVDDVSLYYNAFDALLFPSFYEGFPLTLVEAQCNGLPIVASSAISKDVALSELVCFRSLEDGDDIWASSLITASRTSPDDAASIIESCGFASSRTSDDLNRIYRAGTMLEADIGYNDSLLRD